MLRTILLVSSLAAVATACAPRAPRSTLNATYACDGEREVRRDHGKVFTSHEAAQLALGWSDDEGEHYVSWPSAATTMEAVEYVMPSDAKSDAVERVYDTSKGMSRADWRVVKTNACLVKGGYSDVLSRFASGASVEQVAKDLALDEKQTRALVHEAIGKLQHRYAASL